MLSALAGGEWNCEAKSSSSSSGEETVMFGAPVGSWEGLRGCPDASSLASSGNEKGDVMVQNHKHLLSLSYRRKCTRGNLNNKCMISFVEPRF